MALQPLQAQNFFLAGAGAIAGATSIILKSFKMIDGSNIAMSDLGSIAYMTLEPGNNTLEEQISFTGVVQNANGTATLSGVKTILMESPYTQTSGLAQTHAGSTTAVLTNTSGYYNEFAIKQNDEAITGQWTFPNPPLANANPATKQYVDDLVSGGTITVSGLIVAGTAGETVAAGQFVYLKVSDGLWYLTDADSTSTTDLLQIGIAQGAGTVNNPVTGGVMLQGIDTNQSALTPGTLYYLSGTAGAISSSAGTVERAIGQGRTTTSIYFNPDFYYIPTATQKAAFAGTSGTPSGSNKFVTAADAATTGTADKIVRGNSSGKIDLSWLTGQGGSGADGALSITSGTTTINLGGAKVYVLNYTTISITGTGALAFSNPASDGTAVIINYTTSAVLTSSATPMINCSGLGGAGGTGGSGGAGAVGGSNGSDGTMPGVGATSNHGLGGDPGTGGAQTTTTSYNNPAIASIGKYNFGFIGAGGGGGGKSGTGDVGGTGGRGGGMLVFNGAGPWTYTTANGISVAGQNGSNGTGANASCGGGAGSGGFFAAFVNSIVSNTGTITTTAATGGSGTGADLDTGGGGAGNPVGAGNNQGSSNDGGNAPAGLSLGVALLTTL